MSYPFAASSRAAFLSTDLVEDIVYTVESGDEIKIRAIINRDPQVFEFADDGVGIKKHANLSISNDGKDPNYPGVNKPKHGDKVVFDSDNWYVKDKTPIPQFGLWRLAVVQYNAEVRTQQDFRLHR